MNIPKRFIGKDVRIYWYDPRTLKIISHEVEHHSDIPKGKAALAVWTERGMIEKVEDGTVYLLQSIGVDPPKENDQEHSLIYSIVPEDLIFKVTVLLDGETIPVPAAEAPPVP